MSRMILWVCFKSKTNNKTTIIKGRYDCIMTLSYLITTSTLTNNFKTLLFLWLVYSGYYIISFHLTLYIVKLDKWINKYIYIWEQPKLIIIIKVTKNLVTLDFPHFVKCRLIFELNRMGGKKIIKYKLIFIKSHFDNHYY